MCDVTAVREQHLLFCSFCSLAAAAGFSSSRCLDFFFSKTVAKQFQQFEHIFLDVFLCLFVCFLKTCFPNKTSIKIRHKYTF